MNDRPERQAYHAYLLRVWQERTQHESVWHASLESPHSATRHYFNSLHHLLRFLRARLSEGEDRSRQDKGEAVR